MEGGCNDDIAPRSCTRVVGTVRKLMNWIVDIVLVEVVNLNLHTCFISVYPYSANGQWAEIKEVCAYLRLNIFNCRGGYFNDAFVHPCTLESYGTV